MANMNSGRFFSHIEREAPAFAYLLAGEDGFLVDRALDALLKKTVDPATRDFNLDIFYAKDSRPDDIASQAQTFPMMAERRTVVVKEADKLKDLKPLSSYMEAPSPTTVLILVAQGAERSKEAALGKALGKDAVSVHFYGPTEAETVRWVGIMAADAGYRMAPDASAYLRDVLGENLALIEAELKKVFNFVGDRKTVTLKDVEEAVGDFGMPAVFELVDRVADKSTGKALEILDRLLGEGEQPLMVLGMLSRHWRRLIEARERITAGDGPAELEKRFRLNFKNKAAFIRQAGNLGAQELRSGLASMAKADGALKGSRLPDGLVMHRLVLELSGRGGF